MIEITVRLGTGDYDAVEALEQLCDAMGFLNIPMEVTDTWKKDGCPIPIHIIYRAKLAYMKKHGVPPQGITFKSEYPGFQENIDRLTQVCKTDRFSLTLPHERESNVVKELRSLLLPDRPAQLERGQPAPCSRYIGPRFTKESCAAEHRVPTECHEPMLSFPISSYFDVTSWRWVADFQFPARSHFTPAPIAPPAPRQEEPYRRTPLLPIVEEFVAGAREWGAGMGRELDVNGYDPYNSANRLYSPCEGFGFG